MSLEKSFSGLGECDMGNIEQFLAQNGLWLGALVLLLQQCGVPIPIPADLLIIAVAIATANDYYPLPLALIAMFIPLWIGGMAHYGYARGPGQRLLGRYGKYMGLTPARLETAQANLMRNGMRAILWGIATPIVRLATMWAAGLAGFPFLRYSLALALGCAVYVGWHFALGYVGGELLKGIISLSLTQIFLSVFLLGALISAFVLLRRARNARVAAMLGSEDEIG